VIRVYDEAGNVMETHEQRAISKKRRNRFSCLTLRWLYDLTVVASCLVSGQLKIHKVPERELLCSRFVFSLRRVYGEAGNVIQDT
jgi:hypothetical protein